MSGKRVTAERMTIDIAEAFAEGARAQAEGRQIPRQDHCGGALVRVNRQEAYDLQRENNVRLIVADEEQIPAEQRVDLRVRCVGTVEPRKGLCYSCSQIEVRMRAHLRTMQKGKPAEPARSGRSAAEQ